MATISLCMIVKNEEDVLARCLDSMQDLVDEIIIVDTGSTDQTKQIAVRYTDRVFDFAWIDDFAAARNFAFEQAAMDYCMWLDADDVLPQQEQQQFLSFKAALDHSVDVVMMKYHIAFDAYGNPTYSYYRERIVRNREDFRWVGAVHEVIVPHGNIIHTDLAIRHQKLHPGDPDRNLRIFEKLLAAGQSLDPRQQFYYGRELYYHQQYDQAIQVFRQFLDQNQGWVENNIDACRQLALCYQATNRPALALQSLFRSLMYDLPRAECCCDIGRIFFDQADYRQAAFWYEMALSRPMRESEGGFTSPDCYGYLPCIQLCVCYDHLGDHALAESYNTQAGSYKPESPAYLANLTYFASLKENAAK